jgi:tetratricopeptide (TPR) repeat protein
MKNCKHTNLVPHYPGIWKWGISWECTDCDQQFLCECFSEAVIVLLEKSKNTFFEEEYLQKGSMSEFVENFNPTYIKHLSGIDIFEFYYHGEQALERIIEKNLDEAINWFKSFVIKPDIKYLPNICHVCSEKPSDHYYCGPPYGSIIKQKYGAYIQKQMYQWGFSFVKNDTRLIPYDVLNKYFYEVELNPKIWSLRYIEEEYDEISADEENFIALIEDLPDKYSEILTKTAHHLGNYIGTIGRKLSEIREQKGKKDKAIKAFERKLENDIREKLGYYKVGKKFLNETNLFKLVEKLHPECTIIHHYRPSWLFGQELDVFIKELNIGIEYQGEQHYQSIDFFGGDSGLKATQERDERKAQICAKEKVPLILFRFDEVITEKLVAERLSQVIDV